MSNNVTSQKLKSRKSKIRYVLHVTAIVGCITVLVIYLLLHTNDYIYNTALGAFLGEVLPDIFAALLSVVVVYFLFTRKGVNPTEVYEEGIESNHMMIAELNKNIDLLKLQIKLQKEETNISKKIFRILDASNVRFKNLVSHINYADHFSKGLSTHMLNELFNRYEPITKGLRIKDEILSLQTYVYLWEYLSEFQKKISDSNKKLGINNTENCLIARVVHSNTIDIWTNEHDKYKDLSRQIFKWKKRFIDNGGIIVRIIIGDELNPNNDYLKAMDEMRKIGIEVKYLARPISTRIRYDFLLLYDESFIVKWISDAPGVALSECEYLNSNNKETARRWEDLFYLLRDRGNSISSIPDEREFFIKRPK
jgi:hypothetical protein